ncbi:MAG: ribosomal RNA small subunit methyltransferase A [Candidatus Rokubacteria bacterium]|nr:ribosomal RNA small subunit methyltransferase A [Candidatus Rokubacteria bacterium]
MTASSRRRALGQHFLADPAVADRIVEAVGATADDLVCEIGAGHGVLTGRLAARAGRVLALEIDPALHAGLAARAGRWPNVAVELADGRTYPYERLRAAHPVRGRILVAGNLPYSASKPILLRLWDSRGGLDAATLMLQREVAERLVAAPGGKAYGALSVLWQVWADLALLFAVPPGAFRPPPAVESAVVRAAFRASPRVPIADPAAFARVVKAGFAQRRKTLANALRAGLAGLGAAGVEAALAGAGIDGRRRAETLSLPEFARLAQFFAGPEAA